ncbi:MAG: DUF368 domain-containing protein [Oscillospiraceae bacterium]|nr:DUF368 domain-containing protein [Oscillospiraceae bacterium]
MKKHLRNYINGTAFGVAQVIPGVSGGTIAIILGFYDELIASVNHFAEDYRKSLKFLIPFMIGIACAILLLSSVISYLLTSFSFPTMMFFIGMIVGITPLVYNKIKEPGKRLRQKDAALVVIPMILLVLFSGLKPQAAISPAEVINDMGAGYMAFLFLVGVIAASALIIPGVSGSFIMLLMGVYHVVVFSVSSIRHWLLDMPSISLFLDICKVLLPFTVGVAIGVLLTARLVEKLLKNYHKALFSVILGLLLGSVYVLLKEPLVYQSGVTPVMVIAAAVTFPAGCAVAFMIGKRRL